MEPLEVDGTQPDIVGKHCEEMIAVEYWHDDKLVDSANVAHFKFEGHWYRLHFDSGIIFWRSDKLPPEAFEAPEMQASYRLVDLAEKHDFKGKRLLSIHPEAIEGGSQVALAFETGKRITFRNVNDVSTYLVP